MRAALLAAALFVSQLAVAQFGDTLFSVRHWDGGVGRRFGEQRIRRSAASNQQNQRRQNCQRRAEPG